MRCRWAASVGPRDLTPDVGEDVELGGFAELASGLWCRPANLREPPTATRQRLTSLGLEPDAILTRVCDIPGVKNRFLFNLWPRREIERDYRKQLRAMQSSRRRLDRLSLEAAAKEDGPSNVGNGGCRQCGQSEAQSGIAAGRKVSL